MHQHLIFFDGYCPFCQRVVRAIIEADKQKKFLFAPLDGITAEKEIGQTIIKNPALDTLVLIENYKKPNQELWIEGKAILKTCLHLGGAYSWLGLLSYLPSRPFDFFYRFVAKRRYKIFKSYKPLNISKLEDRFLP